MSDVNVTYEEIKNWDEDTYIWVDIRDEESVAYGGIPGSVWIAEANIGAKKSELPKDKKIVFYCMRGVVSVEIDDNHAVFRHRKTFVVVGCGILCHHGRGLLEYFIKKDHFADKKIYVTAVCPGPVNTPFFDIALKDKEILAIKKLTMACPDRVVSQAIRDSYHKKTVSVYNPLIKGFRVATKVVPNQIILDILRLTK